MSAIFERRSIRKFTNQGVADEKIQKLLEAAMAAPSAGNQQPWHFLVLKERGTLTQITTIHPHAMMLREAPGAILICGDPTLEKHQGYWIQDCAAATENLLLEAVELGLGAVWLGIYPREDRVQGIRQLLGIPPEVIPFSLIAFGYPNEKKEPPFRFKAERVHYDKW